MRMYILIIILGLFLQGYSSGEASFKNSVAPYQASGTPTKASGGVVSLQAYFEQDGCQFVQKGSHLVEMFRDTGIDLAEFIEVLPEGFHDLRLYQREFPMGFYIDSHTPQELIEPIYEVISDWNTEARFEIFTIEGTYDNPSSNMPISKDQIDETDQKNVIYWMVPADESIFGSAVGIAVSRVLPSPISFVDDSNRLPFNETNIFMNGSSVLRFSQGEYVQDHMKRLSELSEFTQSFGVRWPSNYLQDFESFQQAKQEVVNFFRNASAEQVLEIQIRSFEIGLEHQRSLMNSSNDDDMREYLSQQIEEINQWLERLRNVSFEENEVSLLNYGQDYSQEIGSSFTRLHFELLTNREKGITYFKNVLKHKLGRSLGLANLYEDDIDMTDQTQVPLMWYNIENGVDPDNPEFYFDNPLEVDRYTLHALSCNYDLETLRGQAQQP